MNVCGGSDIVRGAPVFPYWLLFSVFAAGSIQYRTAGSAARPNRAAPLLLVAVLFTALMIGLRYDVGGDWATYQEFYREFRHQELGSALGMTDPGYAALNWLGTSLGLRIWFVNIVCAAIFSWGLLKFARQQPNPWLAVAVAVPYLIIVVAMGYTRQAVAIGLVLAGLATVGRTSAPKFLLYVLFAASFHKSAIIILPMVALSATRHKGLSIFLSAVLGGLLYFLFVAESLDPLVTNYVGAKYSSQGAAVRIAMNLPAALLFLRYRRRFALEERERILWRNFSLASLIAVVLFVLSPSSTAIDRISLYLIPLQMLVLSRVPQAFPSKNGRANDQLTLAIILYCALVQFIWLNFAAHSQYWLPYQAFPLAEVSR
jgi:hypothetical protein